MSSPSGEPADESDEAQDDPSGSDSGSGAGSPTAAHDESSADVASGSGEDGSDEDGSAEDGSAGGAIADEESTDMADAFAHEDEDSMEGAHPIDLGGSCPLEPELPLLLYRGSAGHGGAKPGDGELDAKEREKLEAHVRKCARCGGAFAELKAAAGALDKAPLVAPRAEKWSKLKSNVLARAGAGKAPELAPVKAEAAAKPATGAVPKGRPPKKPRAAKGAQSTPSEAIAAMVCGSYEEDLLVLQDLEPARRDEIVAHLGTCARCREAQTAFASIGRNLESIAVEWPAIDKWDALKSNVLAQVGIETTSHERPAAPSARAATAPSARTASALKKTTLSPARPVTLEAASTGRRLGGMVFRAALVVGVFVLGVYASDAVRSVGPDGIRRAYNEAGGTADLAVAQQNYELVVREGTARPELKPEVDDALLQLTALRRYNRAINAAAFSPGSKRAELMTVIAQFPASRAARFAVTDYTRDLENQKDQPASTAPTAPKGTSGFDPRFNIALDHLPVSPDKLILWDPKECAEKLVKLQDKLPEGEQHEVQTVIAAATLQQASDSRSDPSVAKLDLQKVLDKTDASSPLNLEARRRLDALTAATGN